MIMLIGVVGAVAAIIAGAAAVFTSQGTNNPTTADQQPSPPLDEQISEIADTSKKELDVKVKFGTNPLSQGDTQTIDVIVLDSETQEPIRGASVQVLGTSASGSLKTFSAVTGRDGVVSFSWPIGSTSQTGDYETLVRVSFEAYPLATVETGFEVVIAN